MSHKGGPMNTIELTVKEFAAIERVTERTVYNWMSKGAVEFRRTPGGCIRIMDRRTDARAVIFSLQSSEISGNPSR